MGAAPTPHFQGAKKSHIFFGLPFDCPKEDRSFGLPQQNGGSKLMVAFWLVGEFTTYFLAPILVVGWVDVHWGHKPWLLTQSDAEVAAPVARR